VSAADNRLCTCLPSTSQPLRRDAEFAGSTQFGRRIVNSIVALGLAVGLSVADTTLGTTLGNLGLDETTFPNPVFIGDTITCETEVIERRESRSRPDRGIVVFEHRGTNQRGELVVKCRRTGMMLKRPTE